MLRHACCTARRLSTCPTLCAFPRGKGMISHRLLFRSAIVNAQGSRHVSTDAPAAASGGDKGSSSSTTPLNKSPVMRLAVVRPDLVDEWVPELNDADVCTVPCDSAIDAWWKCKACGVNYQAVVKDRCTMGRGCPQCGAQQKQQHGQALAALVGVNGETGRALKGSVAFSLAETHPAVAARWDYERNGLLHPTDVDATSDLNVWWRPAAGRPSHERSFRRPVYAFVEIPYSVEEQREAQAALELKILQQVRQASKIAVARENDSLPAAARVLDDIVFRNEGPNTAHPSAPSASANLVSGSPNQNSSEEEEAAQYNLEAEDLSKAVELWERSFEAKLDSDYRAMFYSKESCDGAAVSRGQVLVAYDHFVSLHKKRSNAQGEGLNEARDIPSAINDPDWIQHFTLNTEDVMSGCIAPSARLVFPEGAGATTTVSQEANASGASQGRRMDTLPPPPEEYSNEIRTMFAAKKRSYPRSPQKPPMREDDVAETLPGNHGAQISEGAQTLRHGTSRGGTRGMPTPDTAFGVSSLASTLIVAQELSGGSSGDDITRESMPFDVKEDELKNGTLLGSTALGSFTSEQVREMQYNRGTPQPRRTGRFKLRPPSDVGVCRGRKDGASVTTLVTSLSTQHGSDSSGLESQELKTIQAPGVPRKVSRPRKGKGTEEVAGDNEK
ncbi:unnamed protein product [Trypanosoma congolense IL3000]|uniref:WGS project CAEQ00000000 data, annotated contig 1778 n=1 Tax=Trypanosoma congolense (strain IL3000) TaxID=1068625 RepID=F9W8U0_TRYCI|nr:unnamed protein product [Trypanosoma congolense IL3000]